MARPGPIPQRPPNAGYEPADLDIRTVLTVTAASLIVIVAIMGGLAGMIRLFAANSAPSPPSAVEQMRIAPPPPRLQAAPDRDLAQLRAREEATLGQFAWVDRSAGIVQIPIEMAMDLLSRRGWPQADRPAEPVPPRAAGSPDTAREPGTNGGALP